MSPLETKSSGVAGFFQQILGNFGVPGMKRGGPILGVVKLMIKIILKIDKNSLDYPL